MRLATVSAILLAITAVSASADEPADALAMGEDLYQRNCRACHGPLGTSGSGGQIRGSSERTVRRALGGAEGMPEFEFEDAEIAALVAYVEYLGTQ